MGIIDSAGTWKSRNLNLLESRECFLIKSFFPCSMNSVLRREHQSPIFDISLTVFSLSSNAINVIHCLELTSHFQGTILVDFFFEPCIYLHLK